MKQFDLFDYAPALLDINSKRKELHDHLLAKRYDAAAALCSDIAKSAASIQAWCVWQKAKADGVVA